MPIDTEAVEIIEKALTQPWTETSELIVAELIKLGRQPELINRTASPKQRAFQSAFLARRTPDGIKKNTFVALGGNRSGKTYVSCHMCFALYLRDEAKHGDVFWCVSQTLDRSIGGQQRELWEALPRYMLGAQRWDEKIGFGMHRKIVLKCKDGGKCVVEFRSSDQAPSTFEQAKLRGAWIDERTSEDIFNRLLPRLVDLDGFLLYSDIPEQWWQFERLLNARPDAGVLCQHFTMYDNAHNLPAGAIDQAKAMWTADMVKQKIMGEFLVMEGIVFKEFAARHVVKPFPIPAYWPKWRLIDYGSSAPTAGLWVTISEDEKKFIYREHYDAGHSVEHNARAIVAASGGEIYRETLIDPHAVDTPPAVYGMAPSVAKQYESCGIRARGWPYINVMGEHACVQRVKFELERDNLFVFDPCINTIREFRSWKHKCDKDGKPLAVDAYENENNHALDCVKGWLATSPCYTPKRIEVTNNSL